MNKKDIRQLFSRYKIVALLFAIAIIWAFFTFETDGDFLTARNFSNLLRQMAITGMLASAMVFVIVATEIDLSVGSMLGLLGGIAAILDVRYRLPLAVVVAIVIGLGILFGLISGYLSAYRRIPSFICTLGLMLVFRGALIGLTGGATIAPVSPSMVAIGQAYLPQLPGDILAVGLFLLLAVVAMRTRANRIRHRLAVPPLWQEVAKLGLYAAIIAGLVYALDSYQGIPLPVLVMMVILGVFSVMSHKTVFGRRIYAVGSNLEATRLSGVNVALVKLLVFGLMGLMCAFAGLTTTGRLAAGSPSAGTGAELDAIASCFIGGTSMRGGIGTVQGALIGALTMASLDNGMSMMGIDTFWQMIVKGAILILAVWMDVVSGSER